MANAPTSAAPSSQSRSPCSACRLPSRGAVLTCVRRSIVTIFVSNRIRQQYQSSEKIQLFSWSFCSGRTLAFDSPRRTFALASKRMRWLVVAIAASRFSSENARRASLISRTRCSRRRPTRSARGVPRGWRATDQAELSRSAAVDDARVSPTARSCSPPRPSRAQLYCSWPVQCRTSHEPTLAAKFACALRDELEKQPLSRRPDRRAGPKENEEAGLPSVWFEYDDGKHFLRQAVALDETRSRSASCSSTRRRRDARSSYARAFEQTLRTLQAARRRRSSVAGSVDGGSGIGSGSGSGSPVAVAVAATSVPSSQAPSGSAADNALGEIRSQLRTPRPGARGRAESIGPMSAQPYARSDSGSRRGRACDRRGGALSPGWRSVRRARAITLLRLADLARRDRATSSRSART